MLVLGKVFDLERVGPIAFVQAEEHVLFQLGLAEVDGDGVIMTV